MARPRGTARSRRHAPPLDKPSRSSLLALRWFHDGLQTPTLVRLLVRTEKEEISTGQKNYLLILSPSPSGRQAAGRAHAPRPHLHDTPKRNRIWKPEISKCDFFFWPNMATNGPRAHSQLGTHGTGRLAAPAFIKTQAGSPSISVPHISRH